MCLTFDLDVEWAFMGNDLETHGRKHENIEPIERVLKRPLIEHIREYMKNQIRPRSSGGINNNNASHS